MPPKFRPLVQRAVDLKGLSAAFRPNPLIADEMEFYSNAINRRRANQLQRSLKVDLLQSAEQGFLFKGVLYGNRGVGKSTEVNRLLEDADIKRKFLPIRLDAIEDLNPQTFSVADVLLILSINLVETCWKACQESGRAFHEAISILGDLRKQLAPFFPELQDKVQETETKGGSGEFNFLQTVKFGIRVEGQRRNDVALQRDSLANLTAFLVRMIGIAQQRLPEYELLVVGENFDKGQIPHQLLEDTFVLYSAVFRALPLHLLFVLQVPFVYSCGARTAFALANQYPIYDVPLFNEYNQPDAEGRDALLELMGKRADLAKLFSDEALQLLLTASGGDLFLLFALTARAGILAQFRHEDAPRDDAKVTIGDVRTVILEQFSRFKNEMGSPSRDVDPTDWEAKRAKLRALYERVPGADVPDEVLYQLVRRRAVLFCNGRGRYGVHPLAVEMLREQYRKDPKFEYKGGGLGLEP